MSSASAAFSCTALNLHIGCTQVHQLERDVGNLKVDLAARGQGDSRLLEERSELIDDKARLGRQIAELSRRAHRAEVDLTTSRATAQALASNNAALEERLAEQAGAHRSLQKRCASEFAHSSLRKAVLVYGWVVQMHGAGLM